MSLLNRLEMFRKLFARSRAELAPCSDGAVHSDQSIVKKEQDLESAYNTRMRVIRETIDLLEADLASMIRDVHRTAWQKF